MRKSKSNKPTDKAKVDKVVKAAVDVSKHVEKQEKLTKSDKVKRMLQLLGHK